MREEVLTEANGLRTIRSKPNSFAIKRLSVSRMTLRRIISSTLLCLVLSLSSSMVWADSIPTELQGISITENLGQKIDLTLPFKDETGKTVRLGDYFGKRPVALFLVYYECPNLCTFVLNGAVDAFKDLGWLPGHQYEVVAVSIDPRETPDLAKEKRSAYVSEFVSAPNVQKLLKETHARDTDGWHFLTGTNPQIKRLADEIGFHYRWDNQQKQFAHASAFFILTPDGKISRYFYGIQYPERDVKVALLEASQGKIGSFFEKVLLFCYHYDASQKKYVLMATRVMNVGCVLTLLLLIAFLVPAWLKERHRLKG